MCYEILLGLPPNDDIISVSHQAEIHILSYLFKSSVDSTLFITVEAKLSSKCFRNHASLLASISERGSMKVNPSDHNINTSP
jgi:hypothetical protein